jgi:hypothetical protein
MTAFERRSSVVVAVRLDEQRVYIKIEFLRGISMNSFMKIVVNLLFHLIQFIDGVGDLQMENLMFLVTPVTAG